MCNGLGYPCWRTSTHYYFGYSRTKRRMRVEFNLVGSVTARFLNSMSRLVIYEHDERRGTYLDICSAKPKAGNGPLESKQLLFISFANAYDPLDADMFFR